MQILIRCAPLFTSSLFSKGRCPPDTVPDELSVGLEPEVVGNTVDSELIVCAIVPGSVVVEAISVDVIGIGGTVVVCVVLRIKGAVVFDHVVVIVVGVVLVVVIVVVDVVVL